MHGIEVLTDCKIASGVEMKCRSFCKILTCTTSWFVAFFDDKWFLVFTEKRCSGKDTFKRRALSLTFNDV